MGKLNIKLAGIAAAGLLVASPVWAAPTFVDLSESNGESSLQTIFDNFTTAPVNGTSSVDAANDMMDDAGDSYWSITGAGGSVSTMIIEIAGNSDGNAIGVFDRNNAASRVELFSGPQNAGAQSVLSIKADGSVHVNFGDSGIDFAANAFGFYLDGPGGLFFSDSALNLGGDDQMVAYQGTDTDMIAVGGNAPGLWTDNEFVLAWEDVANSGDNDYNDLVFIVESVIPVPAPATLALLGLGLIGLGFRARRKAAAA